MDQQKPDASHRLSRCAGLVFGFLFHAGRTVPAHEDTLAEALEQDHDWVWLNLSLSDHRARRFLESLPACPDEARSLLTGSETRIQIHLTPDGAHGVLPGLQKDFNDHTLGAGRLAFWLDGTVLLTARRHPLEGVEAMRDAVLAGLAPASPAEALVRLAEAHQEAAEARLMALGADLDDMEDAVLAEHASLNRLALGPLRRELSRHHREFASLRSALQRAIAGRAGVAGGPLHAHLPQLLQDAEDFDRDAAALLDRARLLYEEVGARISETTNRSLSTLTVISTLLLPPTFVAGAFGMNVDGLPWAHDRDGFLLVLLLCLLLVGVSYVVLRRFRILP